MKDFTCLRKKSTLLEKPKMHNNNNNILFIDLKCTHYTTMADLNLKTDMYRLNWCKIYIKDCQN